MKDSIPPHSTLDKDSSRPSPRLFVGGCVVVAFIVLLLRLQHPNKQKESDAVTNSLGGASADKSSANEHDRRIARASSPAPGITAEQIVSNKINSFAGNRRAVANAIARKYKLKVPDELDRFFEAVEAGRWDEVEGLAKALRENLHSADLMQLWPPVHETWGAVQEARNWPAQKLLDYGDAILGALRPGMVYVGGTDPGRWIPTLLNESNEGEQHVMLTQNALADGTYLDYVNFLYGDRLAALSTDDSRGVFDEYIADARKRLQHDQDFPDEPKQIRSGEDIQNIDGRVQVSGQVAVMAINEKLLQALMQKNPDVAFGLQESFPFKSTYPDAMPLGPIMELRAPDRQNGFTAERAAQSLEYWRTATQQLLSDTTATGSETTLLTHSHDAVAAANLLAAHGYSIEAEQAYRLSNQLWPRNPEPVGALSELLISNGRADEARHLLEDFARAYPGEQDALARIRATWSIVAGQAPAP